MEFDWSPKTGDFSKKQMIKQFLTIIKTFFCYFKYLPIKYLGNPRVVFYFEPNQTYVPLGMDISCTGNLFVGLYRLSQVVEINPRYVD